MANRDLIVIGGSVGSIEPLKTILRQLRADLPAAVVVVIHIPPNSSGLHHVLASAKGPLPVSTARDAMQIERGHVYVAPADHHLLVVGDQLKLGRGPRENHARPAIDPLFRSAAASRGARTIGIVLSGYLDDGASGLETIRRCGGIALVQAPNDAQAAEMPLAALETTSVDLSADAAAIAEAINRLAHETPPASKPVSKDVRVEIDIAAGQPVDNKLVGEIAHATTLTCPDCGGVLSTIAEGESLRFRCQIGHGHTVKSVLHQQQGEIYQALQVALRIVQERADLVDRMRLQAVKAGRRGMAEMYSQRAIEYRCYAETIRRALHQVPDWPETLTTADPPAQGEVLGSDETFAISETVENG